MVTALTKEITNPTKMLSYLKSLISNDETPSDDISQPYTNISQPYANISQPYANIGKIVDGRLVSHEVNANTRIELCRFGDEAKFVYFNYLLQPREDSPDETTRLYLLPQVTPGAVGNKRFSWSLSDPRLLGATKVSTVDWHLSYEANMVTKLFNNVPNVRVAAQGYRADYLDCYFDIELKIEFLGNHDNVLHFRLIHRDACKKLQDQQTIQQRAKLVQQQLGLSDREMQIRQGLYLAGDNNTWKHREMKLSALGSISPSTKLLIQHVMQGTEDVVFQTATYDQTDYDECKVDELDVSKNSLQKLVLSVLVGANIW